jgi:sulfite reductase beta subunit-like hemoprotein
MPAAVEACRAHRLGDADASLVTISPFAGAAEHRLRAVLVRGLADIDLERLSRKFVVHVDDAEGTTADRSADLSLRLVEGRYAIAVRALGTTTCGSAPEAARLARRLADRCIQLGPSTRAADLAASAGTAALVAALGHTRAWQPSESAGRPQPPGVGVTVLANGAHQALAAARFGRVNGATLGALGHLLRQHRLTTVRITPWRTLAFTCSSAAQAAAVVADAASIGLLTDRQDPAVGVIACIGAVGCWQTQLNTLAEAERFVAHRPAELEPGALVHVSGCDKLCATRGPVALTLLGRTNQTGFDAFGPHAE